MKKHKTEMDNYKIAVEMLIEVIEFLIEDFEEEVYLVLENEESMDFESKLKGIKKRIEVVRRLEV